MKSITTILFLFIFGISHSQQVGIYLNGTDYEGVSFSGEYMVSKGKYYKEYLTPTAQEIEFLESIIEVKLDKFKKLKTERELPTYIIDNLEDYKRQYFGYIDQAGDKIIYINFLHNSNEFAQWRAGEIIVKDGGYHYWRMKYNLSTNRIFDLYVNGDA